MCLSRYSFSPSGDYRMPKSMDYNSVLEHIRALPMITNPEVFGLHENADITKDNNETTAVLTLILTWFIVKYKL